MNRDTKRAGVLMVISWGTSFIRATLLVAAAGRTGFALAYGTYAGIVCATADMGPLNFNTTSTVVHVGADDE